MFTASTLSTAGAGVARKCGALPHDAGVRDHDVNPPEPLTHVGHGTVERAAVADVRGRADDVGRRDAGRDLRRVRTQIHDADLGAAGEEGSGRGAAESAGDEYDLVGEFECSHADASSSAMGWG
jgi:hypothetical protein